MCRLLLGGGSAADQVLVHVLEDFPDGDGLAAGELLKVVGEGGHLAQADGSAKSHHAVTAEGEVCSSLRPHILGGAGHADGVKKGVLLLAKWVLEPRPYNVQRTAITWERSTMRSWLNGFGKDANNDGEDYSGDNAGFINSAFNKEEFKSN